MMTILPMIVLAIALILFSKKFTLTDQRVKEIGEELKAKENGND